MRAGAAASVASGTLGNRAAQMERWPKGGQRYPVGQQPDRGISLKRMNLVKMTNLKAIKVTY